MNDTIIGSRINALYEALMSNDPEKNLRQEIDKEVNSPLGQNLLAEGRMGYETHVAQEQEALAKIQASNKGLGL